MGADQVAGAALDAWLESDDHLWSCIGHSEGVACCLEAGEPGSHYGQRQTTVLAVVFGALRDAGYRLLGPDGVDALRTIHVTIADTVRGSEGGEARIRATPPAGG